MDTRLVSPISRVLGDALVITVCLVGAVESVGRGVIVVEGVTAGINVAVSTMVVCVGIEVVIWVAGAVIVGSLRTVYSNAPISYPPPTNLGNPAKSSVQFPVTLLA
jgi:hypothetical protein